MHKEVVNSFLRMRTGLLDIEITEHFYFEIVGPFHLSELLQMAITSEGYKDGLFTKFAK